MSTRNILTKNLYEAKFSLFLFIYFIIYLLTISSPHVGITDFYLLRVRPYFNTSFSRKLIILFPLKEATLKLMSSQDRYVKNTAATRAFSSRMQVFCYHYAPTKFFLAFFINTDRGWF